MCTQTSLHITRHASNHTAHTMCTHIHYTQHIIDLKRAPTICTHTSLHITTQHSVLTLQTHLLTHHTQTFNAVKLPHGNTTYTQMTHKLYSTHCAQHMYTHSLTIHISCTHTSLHTNNVLWIYWRLSWLPMVSVGSTKNLLYFFKRGGINISLNFHSMLVLTHR